MEPENAREDRDKSPDPENVILYPWPKHADRDYECISSCGSGTFAQVYKARVRSTGEIVAVKVMAGDKWALQEAAILRGLDHDNICKMIDCFSCDEEGVTCLVMQYASGGDLLERMVSSGPLTERAAADLARQVRGTRMQARHSCLLSSFIFSRCLLSCDRIAAARSCSRCSTCTPRAWCTATSSPKTSCGAPGAAQSPLDRVHEVNARANTHLDDLLSGSSPPLHSLTPL